MIFRICRFIICRGYATQKIKCWKCKKEIPLEAWTAFCELCRSIQPLSNQADYFSYFKLDKKFRIDEEDLKRRFHKLQTNVHPDKFSGKERNESELSEKHSSFLNQAYKTLKNPRSRAAYLLEVLTKEPVEIPTDTKTAEDLYEFMFKIESITEPKEVEQLKDEIDSEISTLMTEIEKSFDVGDHFKARSLLNKLRYYERAQHMIEDKIK